MAHGLWSARPASLHNGGTHAPCGSIPVEGVAGCGAWTGPALAKLAFGGEPCGGGVRLGLGARVLRRHRLLHRPGLLGSPRSRCSCWRRLWRWRWYWCSTLHREVAIALVALSISPRCYRCCPAEVQGTLGYALGLVLVLALSALFR